MNYFKKISTRVAVLTLGTFLLTSCEGSRPRRMYETSKSVFESGDPLQIAIFVGLLLLLSGLWLWNKLKK